MAFNSYDSIIAAIATGNTENVFFSKDSVTTTAGRWYSLWKSASIPAAGATPATGAGAAPTKSTTGAIQFTDPTGANKKHLLRFGAGGATASAGVIIFDRLVHTSGLSGTVTTAQTVNSTALTRHTDAIGVLCALEVYTAIGATPTTATISYTNQDGTAGRTGTISVPASAQAQSLLWPMALEGTDTGVKSVQTVTLGVSTGTAGDFGVTLFYPLAIVPFTASNYIERDLVLQMTNLPQLGSGSCLALATLATTTSTGNIFGFAGSAHG